MLKLSILLSSVTVVALPLAMASTAMASFSGTGTISGSLISSGANAGDYNYTINLTNTGTQSIDFLWFAWTPGQDYLYSIPISASTPTGWSTNILPVGGNSGASIQFYSSTMSIAAGNSLDFRSLFLGTGFTRRCQLLPSAAVNARASDLKPFAISRY